MGSDPFLELAAGGTDEDKGKHKDQKDTQGDMSVVTEEQTGPGMGDDEDDEEDDGEETDDSEVWEPSRSVKKSLSVSEDKWLREARWNSVECYQRNTVLINAGRQLADLCFSFSKSLISLSSRYFTVF